MFTNRIDKYIHWAKGNKREIGMFLLFGVLLFGQILRLGEYPGLYMDSIMSDYASARFINQQQYSHSYFGIVGDLQLTGALYHGNLTMLWTLLISLFTGTTSVLQYRIGTAIWCILILACIQYIMTKWKVVGIIKYSIMFALVLAPSFVTTIFTQYYAFLPGTLFVLFSYILWEKWLEKRDNKKIFQVAFWLGLAVYSYFIFFIYVLLFFLMIFYVILKDKIYKCGTLFSYIAGCFSGVLLYVIGFYSIGIAELAITEHSKMVVFITLIILFILMCCWIYELSVRNSGIVKKFLAICMMVSILIVMLVLLVRIPTVLGVLKSKFVSATDGNSLGIIDRIVTALHHISAFMRDSRREYIMMGYTTSKASSVWRDGYFVCSLIWIIYFVMKKIRTKSLQDIHLNKNIVLLFLQGGFLFVSMPIIGGLNPHHYTTFYIFSYLSMGLMLHDFWGIFTRRGFVFIRKIVVIWLLMVICINFVNGGILASHIKRTGGHSYYTHQTTELANRAIDMQSQGIKQFYILPEWGFVNSFEYLTGNTIPFTSQLVDSQYIDNRIAEGYTTFILAYKDRKQKEKYMTLWDAEYAEMVEEEVWYTLDGEYAFTTLVLNLSINN